MLERNRSFLMKLLAIALVLTFPLCALAATYDENQKTIATYGYIKGYSDHSSATVATSTSCGTNTQTSTLKTYYREYDITDWQQTVRTSYVGARFFNYDFPVSSSSNFCPDRARVQHSICDVGYEDYVYTYVDIESWNK